MTLSDSNNDGSFPSRTQAARRRQAAAFRGIWIATTLLIIVGVVVLENDWNSRRWDDDESTLTQLISRYLQMDNGGDQENGTTTTDEHDPLFPLSSRDIWGFLCAICGLVLAAGGGIGGGGILVPIYIFILRFPPKHAIPLSNVTVFGGAVANTLLNSRKRHPLADRPLIDWDLILVMEPLTIAGALLGTNINKLLPQAVIVVMLVVLLSATAYKTLYKAYKMYLKETASLMWSKVETEEDEDEETVVAATDIELTDMENAVMDGSDQDASSTDTPTKALDATNNDIETSLDWSRVNTEEDFETVELSNLDTSPLKVLDMSHKHQEEKQRILSEPCPLHRRSASSPSIRLFTNDNEDALVCLCQQPHNKDPLETSSLYKPETLQPSTIDTDDAQQTEQTACNLQLTVESGDDANKDAANPLLLHILEEERYTPIRNVITIVALFLVVLNINIIKGGGAFSSPIGIECGSLSFWLAEAFMLTCILIVSVAARTILVHRTLTKSTVNYPYVEGDIAWTNQNTILYPTISCTAGFVAGLFGIGGGIVKGPLMLQMGVHPAVASATSACMIFFTSFTATTSFVVFGLLVTDYALALLVIGFVATLLGQTVMSMLLRQYKRNSYIAFSIGIVVVLSAILLTMESLVDTLSIHDGNSSSNSVGGLCSSKIGE